MPRRGNPDPARGCPHPALLPLHMDHSQLRACVCVCVKQRVLSSQQPEALFQAIYNQGFCLQTGVVTSVCLSLSYLIE